MAEEPVARVTTNDGYDEYRKLKVVQHWQLYYKDYYVADTSTPEASKLYEEMAEVLNREAVIERLLNEWENGEYSSTEVEPGIAYCARELRAILPKEK